MQGFGGGMQRTSILTELPLGNAELGEAFALVIDNMVRQNGLQRSDADEFDITSPSWRKLATSPDKTPEDDAKLSKILKESIEELAQSYLLFIAREVQNTTGVLTYQDYEKYMLKYRFGHFDIANRPDYITKVKEKIKTAFAKISAHGEPSGDNLIDKVDMASYIYALATRSDRGPNGDKFQGFKINGIITPIEYAVSEKLLFDEDENLLTIKLKIGYKVMIGEL